MRKLGTVLKMLLYSRDTSIGSRIVGERDNARQSEPEKKRWYPISLICAAVLLLAAWSSTAQAAATAAEISGEIERLTLNDPADIYSGGTMIVAGAQVILPRNLLIDLPANRLSLQQIFTQAPAACIARGESGLAKADICNGSGTGGFATLSAVHTNAGNSIAGDVLIEKGLDVVAGVVSYINHTDGYFRVNGIPGDAATGAMVRLNDPSGRHTIQQGIGCAGGSNCSPDPRFTLDPDNYVSTFSTGYPFCIASTVSRTFTDLLGLGTTTAQGLADGSGDVLCPTGNRTPALTVEPPVNDARLFAPLLVGDSVSATGNYETVNGVRFLSSHTTRVLEALATKNLPTQPDYLFLQEVFLEAPAFQNQRARMLIIGTTTLAPTDVDFWTIHRDPATNSIHEFPLASIQGCDIATGAGTCSSQGLVGAGANIFRIRYDVDFLLAAANDPKFPGGATAKLNPCLQLQASPRFAISNPGICSSGGVSLTNNFGIMSPIPHEIQARTGHSLDHPGLVTLDVRGNQATNGQYLFPFGINLGGIETADFLEIDVNLLTTPRPFEGIPWNLDRRLSPGGCLNTGGCETGPLGSFALDPFPFTGLDPRIQADFLVAGLPGGTPKGTYSDPQYTNSQLSNASNRIFSYVRGTPFVSGTPAVTTYTFDGNNTLIPFSVGSVPADPPLVAIIPAPVLNIFPPIANEDSATTTAALPVVISVLTNDIAVLGSIDPTSVTITSNPVSGSATVNLPAGTITYTPAIGVASGTASFTYTVANNFGSVSQPTLVTVAISTINQPPAAANDSATIVADTPLALNVIANDTDPDGFINPASITIVPAAVHGTAAAQSNGTVLYTPNPAFTGTDTFGYTVADNQGAASNTATVSLTVVSPVNSPPAAAADSASTQSGIPVIINVLANDHDPDGTIATSSLAITTPATNGSAVAATNGTVTYTPTAGFVGTATFTYSIADNLGASSLPATVTVAVVPSNETIIVTRARYDIAKKLWTVAGTTNVFGNGVSNQMTVYIGSVASGTVLGTATVGLNGAWNLNVGPNAPNGPTTASTISVRSSGGAIRLAAPVQAR